MSPSTARNREPILEVLKRVLPRQGLVLEIASGTGEHAIFFARHLTGLTWQPSDPDADSRASVAAWTKTSGLVNVLAPLTLDASSPQWPISRADAIVCINMIHIAPWSATLGLMRGAAEILPPGGPLYLYGPYKRNGRHTAPSNDAFDRDLRRRNPAWGVRDLADVVKAAAAHGLRLGETVDMPANNMSVLFHR